MDKGTRHSPRTGDNVCVPVDVRSSKGALLEAIERYIAAQCILPVPVARNAVLWPGMRQAIRRCLLGPGDGKLVRQLSSAQQAAHEDVSAYSLRFLSIAKDAYPPPRG